jgi:hypothetical protein
MTHTKFNHNLAVQELSDYNMEQGFSGKLDQNTPELTRAECLARIEELNKAIRIKNVRIAELETEVHEALNTYPTENVRLGDEYYNSDEVYPFEEGSAWVIWAFLVGLIGAVVVATSPTILTGLVAIDKIIQTLQSL